MSTPIGMFKKHIQIIRDNGYEIVAEITKPKGQIEISFDDGFLGLFDNIHIINEFKINGCNNALTTKSQDKFLY